MLEVVRPQKQSPEMKKETLREHGRAVGTALLKNCPADFQVEVTKHAAVYILACSAIANAKDGIVEPDYKAIEDEVRRLLKLMDESAKGRE